MQSELTSKTVKLLEDPVVRKRFEQALKKWEAKIQPLVDDMRRAELITAEDLRVVINI